MKKKFRAAIRVDIDRKSGQPIIDENFVTDINHYRYMDDENWATKKDGLKANYGGRWWYVEVMYDSYTDKAT